MGRHRNEDKSSSGKFRPLLDYRLADLLISIGCVVSAVPFGFIAVGVVLAMMILAWLI